MNTYTSVNYHKCCKYMDMENFIFKFFNIANYEIISKCKYIHYFVLFVQCVCSKLDV